MLRCKYANEMQETCWMSSQKTARMHTCRGCHGCYLCTYVDHSKGHSLHILIAWTRKPVATGPLATDCHLSICTYPASIHGCNGKQPSACVDCSFCEITTTVLVVLVADLLLRFPLYSHLIFVLSGWHPPPPECQFLVGITRCFLHVATTFVSCVCYEVLLISCYTYYFWEDEKVLKTDDDNVVLRHTLPVFTGLGRCPIVNWDFEDRGAASVWEGGGLAYSLSVWSGQSLKLPWRVRWWLSGKQQLQSGRSAATAEGFNRDCVHARAWWSAAVFGGHKFDLALHRVCLCFASQASASLAFGSELRATSVAVGWNSPATATIIAAQQFRVEYFEQLSAAHASVDRGAFCAQLSPQFGIGLHGDCATQCVSGCNSWMARPVANSRSGGGAGEGHSGVSRLSRGQPGDCRETGVRHGATDTPLRGGTPALPRPLARTHLQVEFLFVPLFIATWSHCLDTVCHVCVRWTIPLLVCVCVLFPLWKPLGCWHDSLFVCLTWWHDCTRATVPRAPPPTALCVGEQPHAFMPS